MKHLVNFSFKLFLVAFASTVLSLIGMVLVISSDIGFLYKVLISLIFIAFLIVLTWGNANRRGETDTKEQCYHPLKGVLAALIAILPALILNVLLMVFSFRDWDGQHLAVTEMLYLALYLIFVCFTPLLSQLVTFNPSMSVDMAQPAISFIENITTPNAISAPLFLIPIAVFVLAAVAGYYMGHKKQAKIVQTVKNLKNKQQET